MKSPSVLVTGGCGFIGHHLVRMLAQRGEPVRVLDLQAPRDPLPGVEYVRGSVTDAATVSGAMQGARRVFHLAANPNLWAPDKREFARVNHHGTRTVLEAAAHQGVDRIVHTSTESILKGRRRIGTIDETTQRALTEMPGPYCRSKFLAEREALEAAARGLPVVIVNPTLPVGEGDHLLSPPTRMLLMFLNGEAPAYLDCELNMIDVHDVAVGHLLAAERGRVGERYILGNENVRLSRVLGLLSELTGLPMPTRRVGHLTALAVGFVSELVADHITRKTPRTPLAGVRLAGMTGRYDSSKALSELGLPRTPLRASLERAVRWLANEGLLRRVPMALGRESA